MNAITLFTAEVFGVLLRVLECDGKRWLSSEDTAKALGYRSMDGARNAYHRNKEKFYTHSIKAKIDGAGLAVRLFDEFTLRYLCEHSIKIGGRNLLRWLDAGGLQAASDEVIPFDETPVKKADSRIFEPHAKDKNILLFKRPQEQQANIKRGRFGTIEPELLAWRVELERAYCESLLNLLLDHSKQSDSEKIQTEIVADIRSTLEDLIDKILRESYSPTLNAAHYELFSSFWLPEGDK